VDARAAVVQMLHDGETTRAVAHAQTVNDEETVGLHFPWNGAALR